MIDSCAAIEVSGETIRWCQGHCCRSQREKLHVISSVKPLSIILVEQRAAEVNTDTVKTSRTFQKQTAYLERISSDEATKVAPSSHIYVDPRH